MAKVGSPFILIARPYSPQSPFLGEPKNPHHGSVVRALTNSAMRSRGPPVFEWRLVVTVLSACRDMGPALVVVEPLMPAELSSITVASS
jgi:hypothetical protein